MKKLAKFLVTITASIIIGYGHLIPEPITNITYTIGKALVVSRKTYNTTIRNNITPTYIWGSR